MKILTLLLLGLIAFLQYKFWFSPNGLPETFAIQKSIETLTAKNKAVETQNNILIAEIDDLKEGTQAIEEKARSELGMIKPGEVFYQIVP